MRLCVYVIVRVFVYAIAYVFVYAIAYVFVYVIVCEFVYVNVREMVYVCICLTQSIINITHCCFLWSHIHVLLTVSVHALKMQTK